jgi:hypothetical protein
LLLVSLVWVFVLCVGLLGLSLVGFASAPLLLYLWRVLSVLVLLLASLVLVHFVLFVASVVVASFVSVSLFLVYLLRLCVFCSALVSFVLGGFGFVVLVPLLLL